MEFRKLSHCVYHCDYHLILCTKYRRKIFNKGVFAYFKLRVLEVTKHYPEIKIKEMNQDKDHVHFLISIPPTMRVGKVVGLLKSNMSKELKQKFPFLQNVYWGRSGVWSDSYFVSTVGINEQIIKKYIENQGREDSGQAQLVLT